LIILQQKEISTLLDFFMDSFCLGTGVPRHSAGGVGMYVLTCICTWYVSFTMRMRENGSRELHPSYQI